MARPLYFVAHALRGMRQALFVNILAVLTIGIALFVFALFAGVVGQARNLITSWSEDVVVRVYLEDDLPIEQITEIRRIVAKNAGVDAVIENVSKEEALERLRESLGEDAGILDGLEESPLPSSIEIRGGIALTGPNLLEGFAAEVEAIDGVDEVDYGRDWVSRLEGMVSLVMLAGFVMGSLILLAALVTVSNTIKLALFSRKDEIEIMKLCGATDSFVRAPFLIEGFLQGVFGGMVAALGSYVLWVILLQTVSRAMAQAFAAQVQLSMPIGIILWLIPAGSLVGLLGSALALGRFLKT